MEQHTLSAAPLTIKLLGKRIHPTEEVTASVVTYKTCANELVVLLRSLLDRLMPSNILVVDNSPDERLRAYVEQTGARYIKAPHNLGFGAGHNRAIALFAGCSRYHLLVNPDIQFMPTVIDELCEFMDTHLDVGLVMPRILYPDGNEQRLCKLLPTPFDLVVRRFLGPIGARLFPKQRVRYEMTDVPMNVTRQIPCLSGCFMFVRTSVFASVGVFDERYFMYMEDVDLCRRIGRSYKTVFYPHTEVIHGYAKGSYRSLQHLRFHVMSALHYFRKWGWILDSERQALNRRTDPLE